MIGLSGSLRVVGFRPLAGFLASLGTWGTLHITQDRWAGEVVFDPGGVVGATLGAEKGLAALDAIALGVREGEFTFAAPPDGTATADERNVNLSARDLQAHLDDLMEQWGGGPEAMHSPAAVPFVVRVGGESAAHGSGQVILTRGALRTLLAVDGRRCVAEIAAGWGLAETIKDLQLLGRYGLVDVLPAAPPAHDLRRPARPPAAPLPVAQTGPPVPLELPRTAAPAGPAGPEVSPRSGSAAAPAELKSRAPAAAPAWGSPTRWDLVCPLLGFADDRANHFPRPTKEHRCYAGREPRRIDAGDQHDLCLEPAGAHTTCTRFRAGAGAGPAGAGAVPATLDPRAPAPDGASAGAAGAASHPDRARIGAR